MTTNLNKLFTHIQAEIPKLTKAKLPAIIYIDTKTKDLHTKSLVEYSLKSNTELSSTFPLLEITIELAEYLQSQ